MPEVKGVELESEPVPGESSAPALTSETPQIFWRCAGVGSGDSIPSASARPLDAGLLARSEYRRAVHKAVSNRQHTSLRSNLLFPLSPRALYIRYSVHRKRKLDMSAA